MVVLNELIVFFPDTLSVRHGNSVIPLISMVFVKFQR